MEAEQKKIINKKEINGNIIVFIIFINIFPIIMANIFKKTSSAVPVAIISMIYVFQTILILAYFFKNKITLFDKTKKYIIILGIYTIIMILIQLYNYIIGELNVQDIINILSKFVTIFTLIILMTTVKINDKNLEKIYIFLVSLGGIACLYNFYFYREEIAGILNISSAYSVNIKSFFANRNQFGQFLCIAIIADFFLMKNNKKNIYKILCILFFINLMLTMSRTVIASAFIFVFTYFFLNKNAVNRMKYIAAIIMLVIIACILLNIFAPNIISGIDRIFFRTDTLDNASGRTEIWKIAVTNVLNNNPLFGIGRFRGIDILNEEGLDFTQFHNVFVESLVSGGILEVILLIYLIYMIIKKVIKSDLITKEKNFYISSIIAFLSIAMFESCNRFSMGYVDTIFTIFFITIPILRANNEGK